MYPVRSSSVRFWAFDLSCGAGALSSPVREEHPRDAAEFAVWGEAKFARVCTWSPRWLLLSALGIITRELASRQVREYLVPSTLTPVAQPKAKALSVALRQSLDMKVTKVLSGGNFRELGSVSGIVDRVVQAPGSGEGSCSLTLTLTLTRTLARPRPQTRRSWRSCRARSPPSRTCCATR